MLTETKAPVVDEVVVFASALPSLVKPELFVKNVWYNIVSPDSFFYRSNSLLIP